jgi:hypothetical protein
MFSYFYKDVFEMPDVHRKVLVVPSGHYTSPRTMLIVSTTSLALASLAVALRFSARLQTGAQIWRDDWLVLAGLVRFPFS